MSKHTHIWIERDLISSLAFQSLKTPAAYQTLLVFFTKRQFFETNKNGNWRMSNNGNITFTYLEAQNKYKITTGQFRRAIDDLRDKGFLDIAESGSGLQKSTNKYFLSARWREYGTPEYKKPKPRPHGPLNKGFLKGNQYGLNCREKLKTTVISNKEAIVTREHAESKPVQ